MVALLVGIGMLIISGYLFYNGTDRHSAIKSEWLKDNGAEIRQHYLIFNLDEQPEGPKVIISYIIGGILFAVGFILFLVGLFI